MTVPESRGVVSTAVFLKIAHPIVVRVLAAEPGLSHLILDAEHGAFSDYDLEVLCTLIALSGRESIVRVPCPDARAVGRALDRGARGVMIPRVSEAAEVEEAVRGLIFSPEGLRGWDPTCAGFEYGTSGEEAVSRCYVQIETERGLREAGRIAAIPEVTDLFIGPADLSRALGVGGDFFGAPVLEAIEALPRLVHEREVRLGLFVDSSTRARWAYNLGYRLFAVTADVLLLARGIRETTAPLLNFHSSTGALGNQEQGGGN